MPSNLKYKTSNRNNQLDEITGDIGSNGLLRIYDGTQPTNVDTSLGAQTLLAELALSATAASAASSGVLTLSSITPDSSANATGTATWGALTTSGGTRIADFSVGTSGSDLNLNTTSIVSGAQVSVSSFQITGGNA
jgi:hypothetical protein